MSIYKKIMAYEEKLAKEAGKYMVVGKFELDWKIIFPIIPLIEYMFLRMRANFTGKNIFFTKKHAINAAKEILESGQKREEVLENISAELDKILARDKKNIYSKKIKQKQLDEIDYLIGHYIKLLKTQAKNVKEAFLSAYPDRNELEQFYQELSKYENMVNRASYEQVKKQAAEPNKLREWFKKLEKIIAQIREREMNKFYK